MGIIKKLLSGKDESSAHEALTITVFDKVRILTGEIAHIYRIIKKGSLYEAIVFDRNRKQSVRDIKHNQITQVFPKPAYTELQKKALIACCPLMYTKVNTYGTTLFEIPDELGFHTPALSQESLRDRWGIKSKEDALYNMSILSKAEGHTPIANEIYREYIVSGNLLPLDSDTFEPNDGFEENLKNAITQAEEDLPDFMEKHQIPPESAEEVLYLLTGEFYVARVNNGINGYKKAMKYLTRFGLPENEIAKIDNFSAWDYGRCGYIGRFAAHAGYIQEDDSWGYMTAAAENAARDYKNWQEYLAAYFIGRYIAHGEEGIDNFYDIIYWLLKDRDSFFKHVPL